MTQANNLDTFEIQRAAALKLLEATGMRAGNYSPPAVRLFWRLGFKVPPPHFASFTAMALFNGTWFAVAWGSTMWLFVWRSQGMLLGAAAVGAAIAGAFFGLVMAGYYAHGRKKYQLPTWESLLSSRAGNS